MTNAAPLSVPALSAGSLAAHGRAHSSSGCDKCFVWRHFNIWLSWDPSAENILLLTQRLCSAIGPVIHPKSPLVRWHPLLVASYLQSRRIVPRAYYATDRALQPGFENKHQPENSIIFIHITPKDSLLSWPSLWVENSFSAECLGIKWVTIAKEDRLHVLFTSTFCERLLLHTPSSSEDGHL